MIEIAIQRGFTLRDTCMCGGTLTKNYVKDVYQLKIRPTRKNWVLKKSNTIITKGNENDILQKLNEALS